jgi:hypothetical protein
MLLEEDESGGGADVAVAKLSRFKDVVASAAGELSVGGNEVWRRGMLALNGGIYTGWSPIAAAESVSNPST